MDLTQAAAPPVQGSPLVQAAGGFYPFGPWQQFARGRRQRAGGGERMETGMLGSLHALGDTGTGAQSGGGQGGSYLQMPVGLGATN